MTAALAAHRRLLSLLLDDEHVEPALSLLRTLRRLDPEDTLAAVNRCFPSGLRFLAMREIRSGTGSLGESIRAARYRVEVGDGVDVEARIEAYRRRGPVTIKRIRKGKETTFRLEDEVLTLERAGDGSIRLLLAIGGGATSRVDAIHQARGKAGRVKLDLAGSVLASDAFFPFPDGVEVAAQAGATAVVQPGGSVRDAEVIQAADRLGLAMIVTGVRHFRH